MNNREKFLEEYRKLCVKYKLQIDACGHCNSPYVNKLSTIEDKEWEDKSIQVYTDGELIDLEIIND